MMTLHTIYTIQQYQGLSSDTKPTGNGVVNGSRFLEIDTGKTYMYDAAGAQWLEYTGTIRW